MGVKGYCGQGGRQIGSDKNRQGEGERKRLGVRDGMRKNVEKDRLEGWGGSDRNR